MEDKLSKMLYDFNKEYIELSNSKEYRNAMHYKKLLQSIVNMNFRYLYETVVKKIYKKKYSDHLSNAKMNAENDRVKKEKISGNINNAVEQNSNQQYKIVIYTCIVGGSDDILEPLYFNPKCDYYIVTDKEVPISSAWKKIDINEFDLNGFENNEKNRYIKLHPHVLFAQYDYSLYIDGNIRIISDIVPLVEKMQSSILGVHAHDMRDCVYTEANVIMLEKRFAKSRDAVKKQMAAYAADGYRKHQGLYENPILIRKHNDSRCIELMDLWWGQLNFYSKRDQLSLPYAIWKCGMEEDDIFVLGNNLRLNPIFRQYEH